MRGLIALMLPLAMLLAAAPAGAAAQGGAGDDGNPPAFVNVGDQNAQGRFAGAVFMELRDVPRNENGLPILFARFMQVTARFSDGDTFRFIDTDFVCTDMSVANPCIMKTICTIDKRNKVHCEDGTVIDVVGKATEIQAVLIALLASGIVDAFGLPSNTLLELTKLKAYTQTVGPIVDVDGVLSFGAIADIAFDTQ